jgi:DNA-binding transcriptional ArsR family regulator
LVAPNSAEMHKVIAADYGMRASQVATHGVGALLMHLPGVLSWDGRVLRTRYPVDRTVYLAGRGLVLLPSYFCWRSPVTWIDPELPPLLVYPAAGVETHRVAEATVTQGLVSLLGRTRAECLRLLLEPLTTTELAERLGTSVGAASKQAAVLRETGLVTSSRHGGAVLHSTTLLGVALLVGETPDHEHGFPTGQRCWGFCS